MLEQKKVEAAGSDGAPQCILLSLDDFRDVDPQERRDMIGERLYPLIHQSQVCSPVPPTPKF